MREFGFELRLCEALEQRRDGIVSRQLGGGVANPGGRILDIVRVEPGPAFEERLAITSETIPDLAIESDVGPGRARYWKDAFRCQDASGCHPERARRVTDRAIEIGFFERERRGGREYVRQVTRYPAWAGRIIGIENKPDLGTPGELEIQLRTDVSLGLLDEVILATESYVTGAHLNRIPDEVGVWRIHPSEEDGIGSKSKTTDSVVPDTAALVTGTQIEVVREPTQLPVSAGGIELLERHPGSADIAVVSPDEKARTRRRLAERAYGKGWRTFDFPGCTACDPGSQSRTPLPYCAYNERVVDASTECGQSCPGYDSGPEPEVDLAAERERRTAWIADPGPLRRQQSGLDRFS